MKRIPRFPLAPAVAISVGLMLIAGACGSSSAGTATTTIAPVSSATTAPSAHAAEAASLKAQLADFISNDKSANSNLVTFDTLDFDVYSNQKWDRLKESHADDVVVYNADGHITKGLAAHTEELKGTFFLAPDTKITGHPIKVASGDKTAVVGVFEGTWTLPIPDGKGGMIQPTGKHFKSTMATVAIWKNGLIVEEHIFLDNLAFYNQIGLTPPPPMPAS